MRNETMLHLRDEDDVPQVRTMPLANGKRAALSLHTQHAEWTVVGSAAQIETLASSIHLTPELAKRYARVFLGAEASETAVQLAASLLLNSEKRAEDAEQDGRVAHG